MLDFQGRHFVSTLDYTTEELGALVDLALELKADPRRGDLSRRVLGLLFFNPSVRTRVSCESAMARFGGTAIALSPGKDTWTFECGERAVMDGASQEHVRELAPVLSRLTDFVGIRKSDLITTGLAGAGVTASYADLARDEFLSAFVRSSEVPVLNLESNTLHPLQGLADMATLVERLRAPRGQKYVLTWAWHPKSLPAATPHSQLLAAADLGMQVVLAHPPGWELAPDVMAAARERARAAGGSLETSEDLREACRGARVVCAKSWGALGYYGRFDAEAQAKQPLRRHWIVDEELMASTDSGFFMHCLPIRRNVIATDGVLDSARSAVVDEAENRLWTTAAVLCALAPR